MAVPSANACEWQTESGSAGETPFKRNFLELCVFLGRTLKAPQVRRSDPASKSKVYHIIQIKHRDEVESPITDRLREAYELSDVLASKGKVRAKPKHKPKARRISP
jgi:hypothetical protein